MGSFYELAFPDVNFSLDGDTFVNCPFPHKLPSGDTYYENTASMSVNLEKGIHHCFGCHAKGNEIQFIKDYMNTSYNNALLLKSILDKATEDEMDWQKSIETLKNNPSKIEILKERFGFSEEVIEELQIGLETAGKGFSFPVFLFGKLVDVIAYNPDKKPKYKKRIGSHNGIIMPYREWKESTKHTIIVAGQKDLAIARTHGLNAIAITGGEGEIPEIFLNDFEDKIVHIIYDNDDRGNDGAIQVAIALKPHAKQIRIVDLSSICTEKGEDLWDFFMKYGKSKKDLIKIIMDTKPFSKEDYEKQKEKVYPTVSLTEAVRPELLNRTLRSNIQVIATEEEKFLMPSAVTFKKVKDTESKKKNKMPVMKQYYWNFNPKKPKTMFSLIDSNLKEHQVNSNLLSFIGYPEEEGVSIQYTQQEPIYKCVVADYFEKVDFEKDRIVEFTAYSLGVNLESGKRYKITYQLVPHPHQGNALYMIIFEAQQSEDSISQFKINDRVKESLIKFQHTKDVSLDEKIQDTVERVKGLTNADFDNTLIEMIDLWYHTPLRMDVGRQKGLRAYLDMLIIAESRVGKSNTVETLQKEYGLGTVIPLNGSNATVAGIIGGSHRTKNGYQIRAGIIPRSHKGAVIFEELAKAPPSLTKEFTQVRSSNAVTITRVSGQINIPAYVRMLTLSNTRATGSSPRPISSYPNGIEIVTDLIGAAEDIARYDIIAVLPGRGAKQIDPFFEPKEPYKKEDYRNRIRWVWSRESHQIVISKRMWEYATQKANELNELFDSYIKLFGTEARLKLIRLATAVAGYVCSTDEDFNTIIVKDEHIDYAFYKMLRLYDNNTFRFREYVNEEKKYRDFDQESIKILQEIWNESPALLLHLESASRTNQKTLTQVSGLDDQSFKYKTAQLTKGFFIRFEGYDIIPTEKFRKTVEKIDREVKHKNIRIGLGND